MKKFRHLRKEASDCWYNNQPEWGKPASTKKAKQMTPGEKLSEEDYDRIRDAQAVRGTRKSKSIGYTSKPVSKETGDKAKAAALAAVKKQFNIEGIRSTLYKAAKLMGDANAVKKGKVPKRIARRTAGKIAGRALGKLFK